MKEITKSKYLYLKAKKHGSLLNSKILISDEEYDYLMSDEHDIEVPDEPQEIHTITFKDGDEIIKTITGEMGTDVSCPYVEKEGYEFLGWSLDGKNVTMPVDGIYDADITYIAVWEKIENQEEPIDPQEETYNYSGYDFGVDGIGYNIISLEERTVKMCPISLEICRQEIFIMPNEVTYNDINFKIIGGIWNHAWKKIIFNKYCINERPNHLMCEEYEVNEENPHITAINGILYSKDLTKLIDIPWNKNIEEYIIPNEVLYIEDFATQNYYLKRLIFNDNIEILHNLGDARNLEYLKLSNNIKNINCKSFTQLYVFPKNSKLKKLILPSKLETLNPKREQYYDYLPITIENITIYKSNIANYKYLYTNESVFSKLSNLKELHIVDETPVELEDGVFTDGQYFTIKVYVPKCCKTIYENTEGWNKFYNIIEE